jgi:hypothetical protein
VFGTLATLPTEVVYPETAPYLKTLRDPTAPAAERLGAIRWLRLNGYDSLAEVKDECGRVHDEIAAARLAAAGGLPIGVDSGPTRAECMEKFEQMKRLTWERKHPGGPVAVEPPPGTPAGFVAGGSFEIGDPKRERVENLVPAMLDDIRRSYNAVDGGPTRAECMEKFWQPLTPEQRERAERFAQAMCERIEAVSPEVAESIAELETMLGVPAPWAPTPGEIFEVQTDLTGDRWLRMQMGRFSAICLEANRPPMGTVTRMRPALIIDADAPPPRPDGFSQAQIDAAKAVLLAPVAPRGRR